MAGQQMNKHLPDFTGKPIKCRALVTRSRTTPGSIEEIIVDPPKPSEVRIKMMVVSICQTDVGMMDGHYWNDIEFPIICGHEGVGMVESVGEGVTKVARGDTVVPCCLPWCGKCKNCTSPNYQPCRVAEKMDDMLQPDGSTRYHTAADNKPVKQLMFLGLFSEFVTIPEMCTIKINPEAPIEKICPIGCAVVTGTGTVRNVARVTPGSAVGVFGVGAVGLSCLRAAKLAGATKIFAIDLNTEKFLLAKQMGATHCVNPKDHPAEKALSQIIIDENGGEPLDFSIECIGNPGVMKHALLATHPNWGRMTIVGSCDKEGGLAVNPVDIMSGRSINGALMGGGCTHKAVPKLVEEFMSGDMAPLACLMTGQVGFDRINEAIEDCRGGRSIRTAVMF